MKMYHISDIDAFMKVIDKCKGKIELVSDKGSRLNLKSKLSQYVTLEKIFESEHTDIPEMELIVHDPSDVARLIEYMVA